MTVDCVNGTALIRSASVICVHATGTQMRLVKVIMEMVNNVVVTNTPGGAGHHTQVAAVVAGRFT